MQRLLDSDICHAAWSDNMPHSRLFNPGPGSIRIGVVVEVAHRVTTPPGQSSAYCPAIIIGMKGSFVQLARLSEQGNPSKYFWRNAAYSRRPRGNEVDHRIHPIGYALRNRLNFEVPDTVDIPPEDLPNLLLDELIGRETLPENFQDLLEEKSRCVFREGEIVEIPDFDQPSCMRPALVLRAGHQWVQVQYLDENRDFWFHELSEMLHPCGFAVTLGLPLTSTAHYRQTCTINFEGYGVYPFNRYAPAFKFRPLFVPATVPGGSSLTFGSKVEFLDHHKRGIRVGTVMSVLDNHYLLIGPEKEDGSISDKLVCLNAFSSHVLPPGFAAQWKLEEYLYPRGYRHSEAEIAQGGFQHSLHQHDLEAGQVCEAVLEAGTKNIALARIKRIAGHLVVIRFEGYPASFDRVLPIGSEEIYPLGHCDSIGDRLMTPMG